MALSRREAITGALAAPLLTVPQQAIAQAKLETYGPGNSGAILSRPSPVVPRHRSHARPRKWSRAGADYRTHWPGDGYLRRGLLPPGAALTVWQANAAGRYTNPVDSNPAPLDPNFLGVVSFGVSRDGSYRLRTVKPGAYPEPSGTMRTPHIHFDVVNRDYRLVTQMYFPGEPLNARDILLSTLAARRRDPAASICKPATTSEPGVLAFTFDIVLLT